MAVDKKSDHVGNHGGRYTDINGMSKQFTYIDRDKKTKIRTDKISEEELVDIRKALVDYRVTIQKKILSIPASLCPFEYQDFTIRGDKEKIEWNKPMILDEGISIDRLRPLLTLLENTMEIKRITP